MHVFEPLAAEYLMDDLQTTYDNFTPSTTTLIERGIDRLFGDVSKGYQETEQMLPVDSYIIGLGQLALWRGDMQLMPPEGKLKYIITRMSRAELIKHYEAYSSTMKNFAIVFGAIGAVIVCFYAKKKWKQYKERRENDRLLREMREMRAAAAAGAAAGDEEQGDATRLCVICISKPREVIVLNCGHFCMCAECASLLPSPKKCPICRNDVARIQPMYIS